MAGPTTVFDRRRQVRYFAAAAAALTDRIYLLNGLQAVSVLENAEDQTVFGLIAGAAFLAGTLILLFFDNRVLWGLGALAQAFIIFTYFNLAPEREPSYEIWGIVIRVIQMPTTTKPVKARPPVGARRFGYLVAIAINVVMLVIVNNILEWGWIPFLTDDFQEVMWLINLSITASILANMAYIAYDPRWFKSLTQIGLNLISMVVIVRMYRDRWHRDRNRRRVGESGPIPDLQPPNRTRMNPPARRFQRRTR
jgi:hypothetical protein